MAALLRVIRCFGGNGGSDALVPPHAAEKQADGKLGPQSAAPEQAAAGGVLIEVSEKELQPKQREISRCGGELMDSAWRKLDVRIAHARASKLPSSAFFQPFAQKHVVLS